MGKTYRGTQRKDSVKREKQRKAQAKSYDEIFDPRFTESKNYTTTKRERK